MTPGAETLPDLAYALSRMLELTPELSDLSDEERKAIEDDPAVLAAWDDLPRKGRAPGVWWDLDADLEGVENPGDGLQITSSGSAGAVSLSGDVAWAFMAAGEGRGAMLDKQRWAILWAAVWRHLWRRDAEYAAHAAHWGALKLTSRPDPGPVLFEAVRAVLDDQSEGDPLAAETLKDGGLIGRYAAELLAEARRVVGKVMPPQYGKIEGETGFHPGPDWPLHEAAEAGAALRWDVAHAEELEPTSKAIALRKAAERWQPSQVALPGMPALSGAVYALWLDDVDGVPRWLGWIGRSLWMSVWRPELERDIQRKRRKELYGSTPAVLTLAAGVALTSTFDVNRRAESDGEQLLLFVPGKRAAIARVELTRLDLRIHSRLVELLAEAPPAVDALFTFALHRGFERWREMPGDGLGDGEILIPGGKQGLAELLGCGNKDTDYALTWGQCLTLPDIDVKGLWTWNGTWQSAAPGRSAVGMLSIQRALLPGAEQEQTGKGRYFAPWTTEPPLPKDRQQRRGALHLWRLLGVRMAELASRGERPVLPVALVEHAAQQAGERRWETRRDEWIAAGALEVTAAGWQYGPLYVKERALLEGNKRVQEKAAKGGRARAERAERGREGEYVRRKKKTT